MTCYAKRWIGVASRIGSYTSSQYGYAYDQDKSVCWLRSVAGFTSIYEVKGGSLVCAPAETNYADQESFIAMAGNRSLSDDSMGLADVRMLGMVRDQSVGIAMSMVPCSIPYKRAP